MIKVVVTGRGAISAIGNNVAENRQRLITGQTGLSKASKYFTSKFTESHPFGEIKMSDEEMLSSLAVPEMKGLTRTDLIAFKAFEEAIQEAGLDSDTLSHPRTGFISGSTVGGMVLTDQVFEDGSNRAQRTAFLESYDYCSHTLRIVEQYRIHGFTNTINTACSSSANAIMMGARLIRSGRADRVIVGGADSLAKFTVNGFNSLQILSEDLCRPFDANRKGLNLGEAAAYLVLESEACAKGKKIYGTVSGYGNSNDAYHASALSEDAVGVIACMQAALDHAGLEPAGIDYINAHGTATENNDLTEITGLGKLFGEHLPPFSSTKSFTGHTLAAAGALEAVYSLMSMEHGELYASLNCEQPISPLDELPIAAYQEQQEINAVLSNSFGFGGNCTSLVFKQHL
ncbi:beta-ketoacyl-[acyl-carrier-protein] synthase family protein [Reichenbachiella agariperforans]|uniref:3-oxoacyl-[acyl-carrier-protein] synthase 1 n=1 Tax=Reichenbachiella agariperforans TaxID=156994 RepID=A0A1M6WJF6_REIAG|nr:beta-ketoacyl-[acyl-carrier-protein] synthase family protein [Reichenbachiella agariperforans]MBU2912516.1 beta-ketoacyl-[acyl-carrier-protein] synthase family protein [Reichenbachiella agariperforans]SHK93744.1 3-oxoacyl-(acyl-carrier-protein) synthase [Reichenbachiella agariperforans]